MKRKKLRLAPTLQRPEVFRAAGAAALRSHAGAWERVKTRYPVPAEYERQRANTNTRLGDIAMIQSTRITIEAGKRSGQPCIRNMRITVSDVLGWLASGLSHEQILDEYPELEEADILACLAFAANREHRISHILAA
ncbi:DUF433 domain-containing protein [Lamprobacter modestohalophilus]|uniref:DUF433 domain-containing protein n=1 Tax=Lamprobacter modestohalophilus TaxID=1064514 RepID=UPI002ADEEA1C|nr:DUF433 domain-containing protein [Lamprobacter modestohalophilus]MEA1049439.1 DUF433 domain-containing protein [Lamprobacter modestohalophilus]